MEDHRQSSTFNPSQKRNLANFSRKDSKKATKPPQRNRWRRPWKNSGVPGWLTLYGNNVAIRKLPHKKAMEETISEGMKITKDELEHFLQGRDRTTYLAALKVAATSARWREIKAGIETRRNSGK